MNFAGGDACSRIFTIACAVWYGLANFPLCHPVLHTVKSPRMETLSRGCVLWLS
jgi:hypothetical protein